MLVNKNIFKVMAVMLSTLVLSLPGGVRSDGTHGKPKESLLSMYVGQSRVVDTEAVTRMVVGSGKIVSTKILATSQLVITAEEEGTTNIHLWGEGWEHDITIYVLEASTSRVSAEVAALLGNIEGLTVRTVAGRTIIEGDIYERDQPLIEAAEKLYPSMVNLTRVSNAFSERMIYMEVQIVEFNTSELENLGISWATDIAGPTGAVFSAPSNNSAFRPELDGTTGDLSTIPFGDEGAYTFFGIATEITSRLNFLVSTGNALLLATPRLSARSGGEAEFLAGGQVPVITSSINGTSVEYKDFGIKLALTPFADSSGNITARVSTEVSSLDEANSVEEVPGFRTRTTATDVNMRDGETLVISGLMNSELSNTVTGVKWLMDIPVLGKLFQSKRFQSDQSELVIFVTPSIITADHEINRAEAQRREDMITRFNTSFDQGIVE